MKEEYNTEKHRGWAIWLSILALLLIGVGIFFYYSFFRQSRSELIEAVPTDAQYVFEINDNTAFQKGVASMAPYFTEAFALDVLPAYEDIYKQMAGTYDLTISGHPTANGIRVLFNTHIEKSVFKKLLRALSIDPANFTSFEHYRIYTYGTHFKSLKFAYFNHILTVSDDIDLLKKALIQHTHPKNLLSDKSFKDLYNLTSKNLKQNWVLLQEPGYSQHIATFLTEEAFAQLHKAIPMSEWSAFQIRIGHNEVTLSGYTAANDLLKEAAKHNAKRSFDIPPEMLAFDTEWYYKKTGENCATCTFALAGDSSKHHEFLIVMQDTLHKRLVPFGNEERADAFRNQHPSGIYPISDSTFMNLKELTSAQYALFVERTNALLFAPSPEALTIYYKMLNSKGDISNNRYYKFSQNNAASSNLIDFTFFNTTPSTQTFFSQKGKSSFIGQDLAIFSTNCTGVTDGYAAVNIYVMVQGRKN